MSVARTLLLALPLTLPLAAGCLPTMPVYTPPPAYAPPAYAAAPPAQAVAPGSLPPGLELVPAGASLDPEHPERSPWMVRTATSALDGSTNVYATKSSVTYSDHWGNPQAPGIGLSCEEGKLHFVLAASTLDYEYVDGKPRIPLTVRVGDNQAVDLLAEAGNDRKTAYLPEPATLLPRLRTARRVVIRFTPLASQPVTSEFELGEIGIVLDKIGAACPAR